jgi:hypothetical protein
MSTMLSMLHSPTRTFEYIKERGGSFAIPLMTILVIAVVSILLQIPMLERAFDTTEVDLTDTGMSADTFKQFMVYAAVGMAPVIIAARVFITGLLLLLLNLIVRGEATYMQLVKVSIFSLIPIMINTIITAIMVRSSEADSANDVLLSLGALFQEKEGFIFGLANSINPFSIWSVAITIIGASVMCNRPIKSIGLWIGSAWVVIQLFRALLA